MGQSAISAALIATTSKNLCAESGGDYRMRDEVLEAHIRQYIQAQPGDHVSFAWQGGERPLEVYRFLKQIGRKYIPVVE
jgi:sulfatase maturation enzyme AslB (radical SAM superfamily)